MLTLALAVSLLQQPAITLPAFSSWNGKTFAGVPIGLSEKDLKKQVRTAKSVGPDPASVRIAVDKKGWILAAILTDTNERGNVDGFTVDLEKDEPIESLEALQQELGPSDFTAYPKLRFSDWSLVVWKEKGIAAVVVAGSRPLVRKILFTDPAALAANLDLWDRDSTSIREELRIPVTGFDISVSSDPRDSSLENISEDALRRSSRRMMDRYDGPGWIPARSDGVRIRASFTIHRKKDYTVDGSLSVSSRDDLGEVSISDSANDTVKRDIEVSDRVRIQFEDMMAKLQKEASDKYRRITWQAEWRQFTHLSKPTVR